MSIPFTKNVYKKINFNLINNAVKQYPLDGHFPSGNRRSKFRCKSTKFLRSIPSFHSLHGLPVDSIFEFNERKMVGWIEKEECICFLSSRRLNLHFFLTSPYDITSYKLEYRHGQIIIYHTHTYSLISRWFIRHGKSVLPAYKAPRSNKRNFFLFSYFFNFYRTLCSKFYFFSWRLKQMLIMWVNVVKNVISVHRLNTI